MIKKLVVLASLILNFTIASKGQTSDLLCWNKTYKLNWSDFTGEPVPGILSQSGRAATVVSSLLFYSYSPTGRIEDYFVHVYFERSRSWYRDTSNMVLRHEQIHFDIYELYARKLRHAFDSLKISNVADTIIYNEQIEMVYRNLRSYVYKYDHETRHGLVKTAQSNWDKKVKNALMENEKYALKLDECNELLME